MKLHKIRGCFTPQLRGKQVLPLPESTAQAREAGPCTGILFGSVCVFSVGWGDGGWASARGFSLGRVVETVWAGLQRGDWISALRQSLPWHVHWGMKNSGSQTAALWSGDSGLQFFQISWKVWNTAYGAKNFDWITLRCWGISFLSGV